MIELPWPATELHPNARVHWSVKARKAKAYRADAGFITKAAKVSAGEILHITFMPPDRRHRDLDGMFSAIKSGLDGVADAMGINDRHFRFVLEIGEVVRGGRVVIMVAKGEK